MTRQEWDARMKVVEETLNMACQLREDLEARLTRLENGAKPK